MNSLNPVNRGRPRTPIFFLGDPTGFSLRSVSVLKQSGLRYRQTFLGERGGFTIFLLLEILSQGTRRAVVGI